MDEIKCGSQGGVYHSHEHGMVLVIPEGAIPIGDEITIDIGVTLNGPFIFPDGMHPVSPILWLCVKEENFTGFNAPVTIRIPHFAVHRQTVVRAEQSPGMQYNFQMLQENIDCTHFRPLENYGTFKTQHFCSLCIAAKYDESIMADKQYCLLRAVCKKGPEMYIRFAVLYMLDTCMQVRPFGLHLKTDVCNHYIAHSSRVLHRNSLTTYTGMGSIG